MGSEFIEIRKDSPQVSDQKLHQLFISDFRPGYIEATNHKYCLPLFYKELADRIENFEVYDSDTFVVSFPKTGTTWTQEMVWCIGNNFDFKAAEQRIQLRFPFLEVTALFDFRNAMANDPTFHPSIHVTSSIEYTASKATPRFIKSHLPWELLPKQIRDGTRKPRIVYVVRNPKDTCVSFFHHCVAFEGFTGDLRNFVELFIAGRVPYGPFCRHVASFWEQRWRANVLFLRYEEMKRDLPAEIRKVAGFLGFGVGESEMERLELHLSFEAMKANNAVNYQPSEGQMKFMRVGQVGSYQKEMTPDLITKVDDWTREVVEDEELISYICN